MAGVAAVLEYCLRGSCLLSREWALQTEASIGIDIGDLRVSPKDALRKASLLSFRTAEIPSASGDLCPQALSHSGRRHLARFVSGLGLEVAALRADMPRFRLTDSAHVDERVSQTARILELARDLRVSTVTTSVVALTEPETGEVSPLVVEGLSRIGEVADACGVRLAIRPTCDDGDRIAESLRAIGCPSLFVGWDPAAMVMRGVNPLSSIERYAEHIVLFHARDALAGGRDRSGQETGLGEGEVDLLGVLDVLRSLEYAGPYILRRAETQQPIDDLLVGRDVLLKELRGRG